MEIIWKYLQESSLELGYTTLIPLFMLGSLGMSLAMENILKRESGRFLFVIALMYFTIPTSLLPMRQYGIDTTVLFIVGIAGFAVGWLEMTLLKMFLIVTGRCTYSDIYGSEDEKKQ